jgi:hypothetical protein
MSDEQKSAIGAFCATRIESLGKCKVEFYDFNYDRDELSAIISNDYVINISQLQYDLEDKYFGGFMNVNITYKENSRLSVTVYNCENVYKENSQILLDNDRDNNFTRDSSSNFFKFLKKQILIHIKEIVLISLIIFTISIFLSWDTAKELQLTWQHQNNLLMEENTNPSIFFILQAVLANWLHVLRIL